MESRCSAGDRVGEYRLEELLGRGAFGEVWRAKHHIFNDRTVAVKIPTAPEYVRNIKNEGIIQHSLEHGNIVATVGLDPDADPPYFIMEYVPGQNLARVIADSGPLPVLTAVGYACQVLDALSYAHSRGVVHRDLNPGNVIISDGKAKVVDFGLGHVRTRTELEISGIHSSDGPGAKPGTLPYMAPEQREGGEITEAADIFAVGVMCFNMLTGKLPLGMDLPSEVCTDVPSALDEVVKKAMSADPSRRFASARAMKIALESAALPKEPVPVKEAPKPVPVPGRPAPAKRRRGGKILVGVLLVLVATGAILFAYLKRLEGIVVELADTAASKIDGDLHQSIVFYSDPEYWKVKDALSRMKRRLGGDVDLYTVGVDPFGNYQVTASAGRPRLRMRSEDKLVTTIEDVMNKNMHKSIGPYFDDSGWIWISAVSPIRNKRGRPVGVIVVDYPVIVYN